MFNFFHFIKVKVEHIKFTSINQLYYLRNKKLSLLIKRTLNNNNWQLVFYFDDLEKKDIDFICHQINITPQYTKSELNEHAQDLNIYFK